MRISLEPLRAFAVTIRSLVRRPAYTSLSILLTALSVGAVTAIVAVVNATLLRSLPYRDPARLFSVSGTEPVNRDSAQDMVLSARQLVRWRAESRTFVAIEGYTPQTMKLSGTGAPESLNGAVVSSGLFDLLGWKPEVGRSFSRRDEMPGNGVAMISHGLWRRRFGGDPRIVGRVLNIDDEPRAIIGIMPENFTVVFQPADVWVPLLLGPEQVAGRSRTIAGIGRLRPGVTTAQARADLQSITSAIARELPQDYQYTGTKVVDLRESLFGPRRPSLFVLLASVALLLAVAAVNVLSLTYADALARRFATMTRLALGASRADVIRLRISETATISSLGGLLGLGVGRMVLAVLQSASPDAFQGIGMISIDPIVAFAAMAAAFIAGAIAGIPAARSEARVEIAALAGASTKGIGGVAERRTRDALLTAQVALAVVLLIGASLLARNVRHLLNRPTGFQASGVAVVEMTLSQSKYTTVEQRATYVQQLLDAVRALPGIDAASTIQTRFVLNETMQSLHEVEGHPIEPGVQQFGNIRHVTPDIVRTLGMKLLYGRGFDARDRADAPKTAMVNLSFARRYWGMDNPVGKRMRRQSKSAPQWMEVIGVVEDASDAGIGVELGPTFYVNYLQQNTPLARVTLVARTRAGSETIYPALRRAIWSVDANQAIQSISGLNELFLRSAAQPRFAALVATLFASSGLLLVLAGIYATTVYSVIRRTRELGVRAALGASPTALLETTMWQSLRPVSVGVVLGSALSVPAVRIMQNALKEGITASDAPLFAGVVVILILATALAAFVPARRALAIPPSLAMRS